MNDIQNFFFPDGRLQEFFLLMFSFNPKRRIFGVHLLREMT
jgi:hypothetical protein